MARAKSKLVTDADRTMEIDGVPTAAGIVKAGLGRRVGTRSGEATYISPEGHALLGEKLLGKGRAARAAGIGDWTRPPNSGEVLPQ